MPSDGIREVAAKHNDRVKKLVFERIHIKRITRMIGLHPNSMRVVVDKLVRSGEHVRIHDTSPAIYADPSHALLQRMQARGNRALRQVRRIRRPDHGLVLS